MWRPQQQLYSRPASTVVITVAEEEEKDEEWG
jgi:hypothetical protein